MYSLQPPSLPRTLYSICLLCRAYLCKHFKGFCSNILVCVIALPPFKVVSCCLPFRPLLGWGRKAATSIAMCVREGWLLSSFTFDSHTIHKLKLKDIPRSPNSCFKRSCSHAWTFSTTYSFYTHLQDFSNFQIFFFCCCYCCCFLLCFIFLGKC